MNHPPMTQVKPSKVTSQLVSLFSRDIPSRLRCLSVLAGHDYGKILADDVNRPKWGAVWENAEGILYLGGELDAPTVNRIISSLRRSGDVLFGFHDGDPVRHRLPPYPDYVGTTLEFFNRPGVGIGLEPFLASVPTGYELCRMNHDLLERCVWYNDTVGWHGSAERFLAKGLGMCMVRGDIVVSEAYAGARVLGTRELGVITREGYRGRSLATVTCAHLIQLYEHMGDRTYRNCAATNTASAAVTRKMGYQTEREYQLFAWFKSEDQQVSTSE